jgi:hypothetical protein
MTDADDHVTNTIRTLRARIAEAMEHLRVLTDAISLQDNMAVIKRTIAYDSALAFLARTEAEITAPKSFHAAIRRDALEEAIQWHCAQMLRLADEADHYTALGNLSYADQRHAKATIHDESAKAIRALINRGEQP